MSDVRHRLDRAWSALSAHGIVASGVSNSPSGGSMTLENALAEAIVAARDDSRLYVAARNLFLAEAKRIDLAEMEGTIMSFCSGEDRDAALRLLRGLRRKSGIATERERTSSPPIVFFRNLPIPRRPDADMLEAGVVVHSFSSEPNWKYLAKPPRTA